MQFQPYSEDAWHSSYMSFCIVYNVYTYYTQCVLCEHYVCIVFCAQCVHLESGELYFFGDLHKRGISHHCDWITFSSFLKFSNSKAQSEPIAMKIDCNVWYCKICSTLHCIALILHFSWIVAVHWTVFSCSPWLNMQLGWSRTHSNEADMTDAIFNDKINFLFEGK